MELAILNFVSVALLQIFNVYVQANFSSWPNVFSCEKLTLKSIQVRELAYTISDIVLKASNVDLLLLSLVRP